MSRSTGISILCLSLLLAAAPGCSIRRMAVNALGDALAGGTSAYSKDDDPELIREAIPFGLKTIEGLLEESPRHRGLLLAAAAGFTQYSYAFVQSEADYIEDADLAQATAMRARAGNLYRRAMDYGFRALELEAPGFGSVLRKDTRAALAKLWKKEGAALLYWTATAWGARISLAKEDSELTADQNLMEAMMRRALELDEEFGAGSIHDFFISYEGGRPVAGSGEKAKSHMEAALRISNGKRVAPLVSYAEVVLVANQDRAEFEKLLNQAISFDPDSALEERLPNLIAQKRARWLLSQTETLFVE